MLSVDPGQTVSYSFPNKGVFNGACTLHSIGCGHDLRRVTCVTGLSRLGSRAGAGEVESVGVGLVAVLASHAPQRLIERGLGLCRQG